MKFVGHTMGTPNLTVAEAIKLYADSGLDAIEIVSQEGGKFWIDAPEELIQEVIHASLRLPDRVITLTPYYWDINNADEKIRSDQIEGMKRAVKLAKRMGAKYVRAYGGKDTAGGSEEENWNRCVLALKEIASVAEANDIIVVVENHPGTMTRTGKATAKMIHEVGSPCVRALYDPANVMHDTDEDWEVTFEVQKDIIAYVHCKDYYMEGTERKACPVGKGIVPWDRIMKKLGENGYDGYVSFEYEKRWYPDQLEDAEIGVPECMEYIRKVIQ